MGHLIFKVQEYLSYPQTPYEDAWRTALQSLEKAFQVDSIS